MQTRVLGVAFATVFALSIGVATAAPKSAAPIAPTGVSAEGRHRVFEKFSIPAKNACHYDGVLDGYVVTTPAHGGSKIAAELTLHAEVICPKGEPEKVSARITGGTKYLPEQLARKLAAYGAIDASTEGCTWIPTFAIGATIAPKSVALACPKGTGGGPASARQERVYGAPVQPPSAPAAVKGLREGMTKGGAVDVSQPHIGRADGKRKL